MPGQVPTVLVADDEEIVLRFVSLVLKRAGYVVQTVTSGAAALRLAAETPEPPDLAVVDLMMPGIDGLQLCARLRNIYPNLRVMFISGYSDAEIERLCGGPVSDLLRKPFSSSELLDRVRRALDRPITVRA